MIIHIYIYILCVHLLIYTCYACISQQALIIEVTIISSHYFKSVN
jgi:hypothetical protein